MPGRSMVAVGVIDLDVGIDGSGVMVGAAVA
jgi:hypothetical protein